MTLDDYFRGMLRDEIRAVVREEMHAHQQAPSPTSTGDLITYAQAAVEIGGSTSRVRGYCDSGQLNRYGEGRNVRVSRAELARLMAPKPRPGPMSPADLETKVANILERRR